MRMISWNCENAFTEFVKTLLSLYWMPKIDEVTVQDYKTLLFFSHPPASTLSVSCALFWLVDGLTNLLDPRTTSKDNFVCLYINFLCAPLPWLGPGEGPVTFAKLQFNPLLGLLSGFLLTSFPPSHQTLHKGFETPDSVSSPPFLMSVLSDPCPLLLLPHSVAPRIILGNKLGWAEPHLRFPLSFSLISP